MASQSSTSGGRAPGAASLARAIQRLLRPVVRLLIEKQVTFPALAGWLRSLYVEVADHELAIQGRRQTDSRISLLTGIHRKDIKRLRRELADDRAPAPAVALGALLVSRWIGDPTFLDERGKPQALPRLSSQGGEVSFESLISSVNRDIPPRSILDEWVRLGVVEIDADDLVHLRADSFVPEHGLDEKLHFFGRNARDHLAAGVHNILDQGDAFLDRSVFYDDLTKESVARLAEAAREKGADAIREINQMALQLQVEDREREAASHRMTFGAYFYSIDENEERDARNTEGRDEGRGGDAGGDLGGEPDE